MRFSFAIAALLFASATGYADATCAGTIGASASYSTTSTEGVTLSEGCLMGDGKVEEDMAGMTLYSVTASACPGCIVTDASGGQTFIEPAADLGCDMNEVNAANPCVTSSSTTTITTTETSSTSDMSDMTSDMTGQLSSKECLDVEEGRCYCHSATVTTNQKCIPTIRFTYIAANTGAECADYCINECGEDAGSSFDCVLADTPLTPCNGKSTTCDCNGCEPDVAPMEPIQFSGQCGAYCDAFCESTTGYKYSCSSMGGDTSNAPKIGVAIGSTVVAIAVASLAM